MLSLAWSQSTTSPSNNDVNRDRERFAMVAMVAISDGDERAPLFWRQA
jgi:hypothetical protein